MLFLKFTNYRHLRRLFCSEACEKKRLADICNKKISVTIVNALNPVGQTAALLLKQIRAINEIRLFDAAGNTERLGKDLRHIDTSTRVETFSGMKYFKHALKDADIVLVCGGGQMKPKQREDELFQQNADDVRYAAIYAAEFCPHAVFCVASPPINCLVPMISEEYKKAGVYDWRKIIGITTIGVTRANSIVSCYTDQDPSKMFCPIVGGLSPKTTIAVLSQVKPRVTIGALAKPLQDEISKAEQHVLEAKCVENSGACSLSVGYAASLFIKSLANGLHGEKNQVQCAYIRQMGHIGKFLPYMISVVKLGENGIESSHMPKLNYIECHLLEMAAPCIASSIAKGEGYITGVLPKKRRCKNRARECDVVETQQEPDDLNTELHVHVN